MNTLINYQMLYFVPYVLFAYLFYKGGNKTKISAVILSFIFFTMNPVRSTIRGMNVVEMNNTETITLPERIYDNSPSLEETRIIEYERLKNNAQRLKNEINN